MKEQEPPNQIIRLGILHLEWAKNFSLPFHIFRPLQSSTNTHLRWLETVLLRMGREKPIAVSLL